MRIQSEPPPDAVTEMFSALNKFLSTNASMTEPVDDITVKLYGKRSEYIDTLTKIEDSLTGYIEHIKTIRARAAEVHNQETYALSLLLNKKKLPPVVKKPAQNPTWTLVSRRIPTHDVHALKQDTTGQQLDSQQVTSVNKTERVPSKPVLAPVVVDSPAEARYNRIKVTEGLSIPAISVTTFTDVKQDGNLYYLTDCDHFAFKLAGFLFHGNIGSVYTESRNPQKIKECKFTGKCSRTDCSYYHDPAKTPGSRDRRNYIASSFLYTDPHNSYNNKAKCRRFGSYEYLETDIVQLGDDERTRFYDQVMHDFLCAVLLRTAGKN